MASFLVRLLKSFSPQHFPAAGLSLLLACAGWVAAPMAATAQTGPVASPVSATPGPASHKKATRPAKPPSKPKPNPYGSPLDTLMSTHIFADVPPAQPFVRETRPDAKNLDYTPLTGSDPARPKPRDPAGVAALQAELEAGGARNEQRAKGLQPPAKAAHKAHKAKPVAAGE